MALTKSGSVMPWPSSRSDTDESFPSKANVSQTLSAPAEMELSIRSAIAVATE